MIAKITFVASMAFLFICCGCDKTKEPAPDSNTRNDVRVGYLSQDAMQHPMHIGKLDKEGNELYPKQVYLDVYNADGTFTQIITSFKKNASLPDKDDMPIEVIGTAEPIDLGGPPGTKNSYKGTAFYVDSWRYLDPKDYPRRDAEQGEKPGR